MLRGFYTAASGMIAQQRQQEALANNIANARTPGYKADQSVLRAFPEMLMQQMGQQSTPAGDRNFPAQNSIGGMYTGVYEQETVPKQTQGDMRNTGVDTDLALVNGDFPDDNGGLFFTVQNADGDERYTRNGNFTIDGGGFLVTTQGYYVLDDAGDPIQTTGEAFTVTDDGLLQTADDSMPLGIAYTADARQMAKAGDDLFTGAAGAVPADATFSVKQGALEASNVDQSRAMTNMMEGYRLFETNQRVLQAYDESMGKAVSEIARLR